MNESSEESSDQKAEIKASGPLSIQLHSIDSSSNSSQNEDNIYFSSKYLSKYVISSKATTTNKSLQLSNNKDIFNSDDIFLKKQNLFTHTDSPIQKVKERKSKDDLSTQPGMIKVKNLSSPKKRYSVFKLVEKEKKTKKEFISPFIEHKKRKEIETPIKKERHDIYGNVINKKNKKNIKISFIDKATQKPLVNIIDIECFRNYNYVSGIPNEEHMKKITSNCQCCLIF
jgi:hypothetical protein